LTVSLFVIIFAVAGVRLLTGSHAAAVYTNVYGFDGKCLDDYQDGAANGTKVELNTCNTSNAQKWTYNANGTITNVNGRCLSVGGASTLNGAPVHIFACDGGPGQQWIVSRSAQMISNPHSGR